MLTSVLFLPPPPPADLAVRMYKLKKYNTPQVINSISISILLMSSKHRQGELVQEISVMESVVRGYEWEDRKREGLFTLSLFSVYVLPSFFPPSLSPLWRSLLARRNFSQQLRGAADAQRNYRRTLLLSQNSACPLVIKKHTEEYLEMNYSEWLFVLNYSWDPGEGRFASQRCKYY